MATRFIRSDRKQSLSFVFLERMPERQGCEHSVLPLQHQTKFSGVSCWRLPGRIDSAPAGSDGPLRVGVFRPQQAPQAAPEWATSFCARRPG